MHPTRDDYRCDRGRGPGQRPKEREGDQRVDAQHEEHDSDEGIEKGGQVSEDVEGRESALPLQNCKPILRQQPSWCRNHHERPRGPHRGIFVRNKSRDDDACCYEHSNSLTGDEHDNSARDRLDGPSSSREERHGGRHAHSPELHEDQRNEHEQRKMAAVLDPERSRRADPADRESKLSNEARTDCLGNRVRWSGATPGYGRRAERLAASAPTHPKIHPSRAILEERAGRGCDSLFFRLRCSVRADAQPSTKVQRPSNR